MFALKNNTLFAFSSSVLIWISLLAQPNLLSQIKFLRNWNHSEDKQVLCYELEGSSEVLYWITKFFFMSHFCKITFSLSTNVTHFEQNNFFWGGGGGIFAFDFYLCIFISEDD